jgi:hypothetical protein
MMMGSAVVALAISVPSASALATPSRYPNQGIFGFGDAGYYGAPIYVVNPSPVVAMAATPDNRGYWVLEANGGLFTYGDAGFYGSARPLHYKAPFTGIASTHDGKGYWLLAMDGSVFPFGDAVNYGNSTPARIQPIVSITATPDGRGYWLLAEDGGIFTFGDAGFYGSARALHYPQPMTGMALSPDGHGYWEVAANGMVFRYGDAGWAGQLATAFATGKVPGWIVGLVATADGRGYWFANADGSVTPAGDAANYGGDYHVPGTQPISQIVRTSDGRGYWLLEPDAFPTNFTDPLAPGGLLNIVVIAYTQIYPDPLTSYFCNPFGPCEPWCALFATWVWETEGIPIPRYAFVGYVYDWAATHTGVLPPTATPAKGDLVLYGTGPQTVDTAVHMGVVAQVWPDGAIATIEGDSGPAPTGYLNVTINGPFLPYDSINANGMPIFAYAVP